MSGDLTLPSWAAAVVVAVLGLLVLYLRWSLKTLLDTNVSRLQRIEDTVHEIDRRVIRIETILDGGSAGSNPAGRVRVLTPQGVPVLKRP